MVLAWSNLAISGARSQYLLIIKISSGASKQKIVDFDCLSWLDLIEAFFVKILVTLFRAGNLSVKCKGNIQLRSEVELLIYNFPNAVTAAHKRRDTLPHLIFAIDNLVRRAVNQVLAIISPGIVLLTNLMDILHVGRLEKVVKCMENELFKKIAFKFLISELLMHDSLFFISYFQDDSSSILW